MRRFFDRCAAVLLVAATFATSFATCSAATAAEMAPPKLLKASGTDFSRPHDLVLSPDGKYLLVADLGNDVVKVLDPASLQVLAEIGRGELNSPHDVAFDGQGRLLVADTGNDRIAVYRFGGVAAGKADAGFLRAWTADASGPEGVAVDAQGRVFVSNTARDTVLAIENGRTVGKVGGSGAGANQYRRPHDVHVDRQGRVLVVDSGNARIQILDRDLNPLGQLGGPAYGFNEPKYVTVDEAGGVLVADEYNNRVVLLDARHRPVGSFGDKAGGAFRLNKPEGVEARDRHLWVSDTYNDRVLLLERR